MKTLVIVIIILVLIVGCALKEPPYIKNGQEYGVTSGLFRGRWWNYYERGVSFAEGGFYEEAIKDLQSAVKGRSNDQWRSRTYGMHFVNYFPHRELGIIYYNSKKFREGIHELEESLKTAGSAKAKYFLNKARKNFLEETRKDKFPPTLKIDSPLDRSITNKFSITLTGEVKDDYFVSSLSVNAIPLPLELSSKKVFLEKELTLRRGVNEIKIQASDLTGKTTEKILKIKVDREGPVIIIEDQKTLGRKVTLSGLLSDSTGIASFSINGQRIPIAHKLNRVQDPIPDGSGLEMEFHQEINLSEGTDTIILKAKDIAENVTTGELRVIPNPFDSKGLHKHPTPNFVLKSLPRLASSQPVMTGIITAQYAFFRKGLRKIIDNTPPVILLKDLVDFQTVYDDALYLEGSVSDESKIRSITINGEPILKRKGKRVFFNYLTRLKEGGNRFLIEAIDTLGNRAQKVVSVNRKIPKIRQIGSRMSISILPLDHKGEQSISGDAVYDSLITAFVNQRRFHVIEREKMEEVLKELRLSQTELVDPDTVSKIGKIVVADVILTGTIYESKNSIEILTRLVNTETSVIMDAKDVFDEDKSLPAINILMQGLALKFKQSFPLLEGLIIKKDGKEIFTDLGGSKKIKKDMGLILFREGEEMRNPITGRSLGSEPEKLGEAKIENVFEEFSRAVIRIGKPKAVKIKDRVITK